MSEQAKRAYLGFWHHINTAPDTIEASPMEDWEDLTETEREAWRAAVVAAVDEPPSREATLRTALAEVTPALESLLEQTALENGLDDWRIVGGPVCEMVDRARAALKETE